MKIKLLSILGLFVALSGCMGSVTGDGHYSKAQAVAGHGNILAANSQVQDTRQIEESKEERRIARMMAWVNLSTD